MSKRVSKRKKSGRATIRSSRDHARALAPHASGPDMLAARAYPSAAELFAQGSAWRTYVTDTLRSLLAPAALAGAVGLAGCAGAGDATNGVVGGDTTTIQSSATLTPIGPPTVVTSPANGGGTVVVTPIPPVTLTPIPPGTGLVSPPPTHVTPPRHPPAVPGGIGRVQTPPIRPPSRPPAVSGDVPQVQPAVDPPQVLGQMRRVDPIPPPIQPVPLGGAPPPMRIVPQNPDDMIISS